jgi:NADH-quinone oxidoreductase subunit M
MDPSALPQAAAQSAGLPFVTLLIFVPIVGMLAILFIPRAKEEAIKTVAAVATAIPLILSVYLWAVYDYEAGQFQWIEKHSWISALNIEYHVGVDGISLPLIFLTALLQFIAVFSSWKTPKGTKGYFMLLLLLGTGIMGVFVSLDFFLFYVFWEVMLLPMYFLIGIWGGPRREYAAIKFFLYTLVGSVLMLIAMIAMYLTSNDPATGEHTFNLVTLTDLGRQGQLTGENLVAGGILFGVSFTKWIWMFLFIGFAIKVPVFPFHTWLPDAHVEAPTAISVILAGILLKLGGYGIIRFNCGIFPEATKYFATFLAVLGMINIVYGAFVAMAQTDFKKLVAYSSVSHMGYVLLGLAAFNEFGIVGANFQMFTHGTSSAMLFLLVGVIYDRAHHRDINGFGGLGSVMPTYTGLTTVGFFASLGLPGLSGFVSEACCLLGAWKTYPVLTIISTLGIIITAAFFLWTIQRVFLGPLNQKYKDYSDTDGREIFCLVPPGFLCILLGVAPFLFINWVWPSLKPILASLQ